MNMSEIKELSSQKTHPQAFGRKWFSLPEIEIIDLDWDRWPLLRRAMGIVAAVCFMTSGALIVRDNPKQTTTAQIEKTATPTATKTPTLATATTISFEDAVKVYIDGTPVVPPKPTIEINTTYNNGKIQITTIITPK